MYRGRCKAVPRDRPSEIEKERVVIMAVSMEDRVDLVNAKNITLDGRPAVIGGTRLPFAKVSTLDGRCSAEWAWETVARIVARDGAFKF